MSALNILADVNVDRAIVQGLRAQGHVVDWLAEDRSLRKIDDLGVIGRAFRQQSLILTNDTEFIGYVFKDHALTHGVILLRLGVARAPRAQQVTRALEAIQQSQDQLAQHFTTIYPDHIEQQALPDGASSA